MLFWFHFLWLNLLWLDLLTIHIGTGVFNAAILIPCGLCALFFTINKVSFYTFLAVVIPLRKAAMLAAFFIIGL